jgi:hypothetical protein
MTQSTNEPDNRRHRMTVQHATPERKLIEEMLTEVQRSADRLIELPIEIPGFPEPFMLTAEREMGGDRPIWTLLSGQGAGRTEHWSYTFSDTDMIHEILSLSLSTPPAATGSGVEAKSMVDVKDSLLDPLPFLEKNQPNILLGHILVDSGIIPEPVLDAALNLQELARSGELDGDEATETLRTMHVHGVDLQEAVASIKSKRQKKATPDAVDLLQKAGYVNEQDISKAKTVVEQLRKAGLDTAQGAELAKSLIDLLKISGLIGDQDLKRSAVAAADYPLDMCKALLSSGAVDSLTFEVASRFIKHVRRGQFKQEQAIIALHYCQRCRTGFEETVHAMGWQVPSEF